MLLYLISYVLLGATLAGSFMVAVLSAGLTTTQPVVWSAVAGFVIAIPLAWLLARKLRSLN